MQQQFLIASAQLRRMFLDASDFLNSAPQVIEDFRMIDDVQHFLAQVCSVTEAKVQSIDSIAYQFRHASFVPSEYGNAGHECFLDRQRCVFIPQAGDDDYVEFRKDSADVFILVGAPKGDARVLAIVNSAPVAFRDRAPECGTIDLE